MFKGHIEGSQEAYKDMNTSKLFPRYFYLRKKKGQEPGDEDEMKILSDALMGRPFQEKVAFYKHSLLGKKEGRMEYRPFLIPKFEL